MSWSGPPGTEGKAGLPSTTITLPGGGRLYMWASPRSRRHPRGTLSLNIRPGDDTVITGDWSPSDLGEAGAGPELGPRWRLDRRKTPSHPSHDHREGDDTRTRSEDLSWSLPLYGLPEEDTTAVLEALREPESLLLVLEVMGS